MNEWNQLKYHELCEFYPLMSEEELDALGDDMLQNGLHNKIVLYEDKILDGKNRYVGGKRRGYNFTEEDFITLNSDKAPGSYTISMNIMRRHIESPAYRIELALKALEADKKRRNEPEIDDENLKKIVQRQENKIIAKNAKSDWITVEKTREIIMRAEDDPIIKEKWEKAKQSRERLSVRKIHEDYIKPKKKKHRNIKIKAPTKIELRQEVSDLKEKLEGMSSSKKELKDSETRKSHYKTAFLKTVEIAQKLGYWTAIKKHLRDLEEIRESPLAIVRRLIREEESPFPTPKQLREAEL